MKKIFLTGHKGFIGGHLYRKLKEMGYEVDTNLRLLDTKSYDCVIHLAATTHIKTEFDPLIYENNILLTKKLLTTPYRTIYASSCSAAHLTNPYAYSKRYAEWLGEKHGNALGLRFHNIYGPGNNKGIVWFLMNQPDGSDVTIRGPQLIRDYLHVDDLVDEIFYLMQFQDREVKDMGTGIGTTTIDLVNMYMKVSGKKFNIKTEPPGDNEPLSMVSDNELVSITLEQGIKKTIAVPKSSSVNYDHIKQNR